MTHLPVILINRVIQASLGDCACAGLSSNPEKTSVGSFTCAEEKEEEDETEDDPAKNGARAAARGGMAARARIDPDLLIVRSQLLTILSVDEEHVVIYHHILPVGTIVLNQPAQRILDFFPPLAG